MWGSEDIVTGMTFSVIWTSTFEISNKTSLQNSITIYDEVMKKKHEKRVSNKHMRGCLERSIRTATMF
jgi:hypothetical protein